MLFSLFELRRSDIICQNVLRWVRSMNFCLFQLWHWWLCLHLNFLCFFIHRINRNFFLFKNFIDILHGYYFFLIFFIDILHRHYIFVKARLTLLFTLIIVSITFLNTYLLFSLLNRINFFLHSLAHLGFISKHFSWAWYLQVFLLFGRLCFPTMLFRTQAIESSLGFNCKKSLLLWGSYNAIKILILWGKSFQLIGLIMLVQKSLAR